MAGTPAFPDSYDMVPEAADQDTATWEVVITGFAGFLHGRLPAAFGAERHTSPAGLLPMVKTRPDS
ncbi:hypothetical protein [Actinoallomurus sp. CA-142502]|uniref:hypothetical protein n=1 Tax=Actinoallomurus sp. CA-142502 TaxID=3239885 RepID=UPI003D945AAF